MPISKEYIIKRLILLIAVVFGVAIITFIITRVVPSHPEFLWAGAHPTKEQLEKARRELRLDQPIYVQLYYYLLDFLTGNWGVSWRTRQPVLKDIQAALPATLELVSLAFIIALIIGIPLGILAALKRNTRIDDLIRIVTITGASIPVFWLALVLQLILSSWLGILPSAKRVDEYIIYETKFKEITGFILLDSLIQGNLQVFMNALKHIILPALVISFYPLGLSARMTRAVMIDVLNEFHTKSLAAWGLPKRVIIYKYALKNTIAPVIGVLGLSFGYTIIGAFLVEVIFVWPGIGYYAASALISYDYPAVIGCIVTAAIIYAIINTIVDILHAIIDPRVRI